MSFTATPGEIADGNNCPYCGDCDLTHHDDTTDGNWHFADVCCDSCGKRWQQQYRLAFRTDFEDHEVLVDPFEGAVQGILKKFPGLADGETPIDLHAFMEHCIVALPGAAEYRSI